LRVALGRAANASLVGANTVIPLALFRVSTRPACLTAVTRVESCGLLEAAVATGSSAMPLRLPGPVDGTAEQAGPKVMPAAAAGGCVTAGAAGAGSPSLLLQPAPNRASPSAATTIARRGVSGRSIAWSFRESLRAAWRPCWSSMGAPDRWDRGCGDCMDGWSHWHQTNSSGLVIPYLHRLGDRWEAGEVSVVREHFASNLIRGRLLGLAQGWGQGRGPRAVLACVPG
jgi:hypothetical protein